MPTDHSDIASPGGSRAESPASSSVNQSRPAFNNDDTIPSPAHTPDIEKEGVAKGKKRGLFAKSKNIFKKLSK